MKIQQSIHVDKWWIDYTVVQDDVIVWQSRIYFGRDKAHQAAGVAFREAAREQDRVATELMQKAGAL